MFRLCPERPENDGTLRFLGIRSGAGVCGDGFCFGRAFSDEDSFLALSEENTISIALAHLDRTALEKDEK